MGEFYPANTSPQQGPHCDFETTSDFYRKWYSATCLLRPNHEGEHNFSANWNADATTAIHEAGDYKALEIKFQSWHDSRGIRIQSRAEGMELLDFLRSAIDQAFLSNNSETTTESVALR